MAADLSSYVEVNFTDENTEELLIDSSPDFVGISMMLTTQVKRNRIKQYHDNGIAVEGTILLGLDNQTEDDIK